MKTNVGTMISKQQQEILDTKYTSYSIEGNYIFAKKDDSEQLFDVHGNLVYSKGSISNQEGKDAFKK